MLRAATDGRETHVLLACIQRVLIRGIAVHPVVYDFARVGDSVAPERLRLDPEVFHQRTRHVLQREGNRASVAVFTSDGLEVRPPWLAVAVDAAGVVGVDDKVVAGDDKPGRLVLDEDDAVGVVRVEPVVDVGHKLCSNVSLRKRR